ncbi:DUF6160 family protein [Acinetobacter sichuanensis]|uniref:DUF6160 family protein n=1 Tax=Acinetobacter sichuanensis TaxID=2136183 RepID=A0A371YLB6_9GAMM|nr:DUF6160 family protein [Acinetobacter sichuanensis]RFC82240.1 hypothetical protein C9E89_017630 [Acinetobacter sichuanensis]
MRKKIIQLNLLTLSILYAQHGFALQELEDSSLSQISGQDGISLQIDATKVQIGQVNWKDSTQTSTGANSVLNVNMSNIETTPYKSGGLKAAFTADVGGKPGASAAASNGLRLGAVFGPATMNIKSLAVCPNGAGITADCSGANSQSLGGLTFQNRKDLTFSLETQSGLFNGGSLASLGFGLKNANLFYTLDTGSSFNQLILKDFNFNFAGNGYLYLDPADGLVLSTNKKGETSSANTVVLGDVDDPDFSGKKQSGLNVDLRYKTNVGSDYTKYQATGTDTDILSFGRIGASGTLKNAYIKVNGDAPTTLGASTTGTTNTGTGSLAGSGGLHMQMKADFAKDTTNPADQKTYFDLGLSGKNAYVLRYGNLTALQVRKDTTNSPTVLNTDLPYINFGHVYINAAQTNTIDFPISALLNKVYAGNFSSSVLKTALYNSPSTTPSNALVVAVRGMDFQAIARQGSLFPDNSIVNPVTNSGGTWGLGLPIYNLNSNVGLYGIKAANNTEQKLGFGISMSTEGRDSIGSKTTSIMLIDGAINPNNSSETVNYYAGLRNINLFANLTGTLGFVDSGLWLYVPKLVAALDAEVAIGQLPGSRIVSSACTTLSTSNCFVPSNNFTNYNDVLFGISARIDGSANLILAPNTGTGLVIYGDITLNAGTIGTAPNQVPANYLRISDKSGSGQYDSPSQLGIDGLSGKFNLNSRIGMDAKTITFTNTMKVNATSNPTDVLKADVNLYPKVLGTSASPAVLPAPQTLGQMVMTGGNIRSTFGITPR